MYRPNTRIFSNIKCKRMLLREHATTKPCGFTSFTASSGAAYDAHTNKYPSKTQLIMSRNYANEVDIDAYLQSIEHELQSHEHAKQSTFQVKIRAPNRKPMIRTLLGIQDKVEFDQLVRTTRKEYEFERMASFTRDLLIPIVSCGDNENDHDIDNNRDVASTEDILEKVPDLANLIEHCLSQPKVKGVSAFNRLGNGKRYKGNVLDMLQDIAPQIVPSYLYAIQPMNDADAVKAVIESMKQTLDPIRISAAMECVTHLPSSPSSSSFHSSQQYGAEEDGKANGLFCERACLDYLKNNRGGPERTILQNVYVNNKNKNSRRKYSDRFMNLVNPNHSRSSSVMDKNGEDLLSGIIWTNITRNNACSEFDAVIIHHHHHRHHYHYDHNTTTNTTTTTSSSLRRRRRAGHVTEIWEAKYCLSPSTLYDAISKKLAAAHSIILNDENAIISHDEHNYPMNLCRNNTPMLTFGIFGINLQPASSAVNQLKYTAASNALTGNDVDLVLNAVECGFVEIDVDNARFELNRLREELTRANDVFRMVLKVAK